MIDGQRKPIKSRILSATWSAMGGFTDRISFRASRASGVKADAAVDASNSSADTPPPLFTAHSRQSSDRSDITTASDGTLSSLTSPVRERRTTGGSSGEHLSSRCALTVWGSKSLRIPARAVELAPPLGFLRGGAHGSSTQLAGCARW
jgi:hypothetical protein